MLLRDMASVVIPGVLVLMAAAAPAGQQLTCEQIRTVSHFAGGKPSADDLAKKLHADVDTVRTCLGASADGGKDASRTRPSTK